MARENITTILDAKLTFQKTFDKVAPRAKDNDNKGKTKPLGQGETLIKVPDN